MESCFHIREPGAVEAEASWAILPSSRSLSDAGAADAVVAPPPAVWVTRRMEDLVAVVAPPGDRGFEAAIEVVLWLPAEQTAGA